MGKTKSFSVHALVAHEWVENPGNKRCVDHIDGSKTNNHWENLRYATSSGNAMNAKNRTDGSSVYKGVSYQAKARKWKSTIVLDGKSIHLGLYTNEREAAEVYNTAAMARYQEFAKLNIFEN